MIAGGQAVDTGVEQLARDIAGQPEAARRILAVGNREIELETIFETRQLRLNHLASRPPDNIADEQNTHKTY